MIYFRCEVDHQQTYTPLFDCERFLPSPLFVFINRRPCKVKFTGSFRISEKILL